MKTIKDSFPLEGDFHFRFKFMIEATSTAVWLDVLNPKVPVPRYKDKIIMKVTRMEAKDVLAPLE